MELVRAVACLTMLFLALGEGAAEEEPSLILRADPTALRTGAYSPFAPLQDILAGRIRRCGQPDTAAALAAERRDGQFGPASAAALQAAHACGLIGNSDGALTASVWRALTTDLAVPGLQDRIDVMVLTFEATDFGKPPEWNMCQDGFELQGSGMMPVCINRTDPCSFLTWGPRGATAGQGREIQWILAHLLRARPGLLQSAFGDESDNLRRFLTLAAPPPETCNGETPLEHFMCALWLDKGRRVLWTNALTRLGQDPFVREAFHTVYAQEAFDGYKLRAYYELWQTLGIAPSEIDYAFFLDRATQIGAPPEGIRSAMQRCMNGEMAALNRNAAARRCLSTLHPHPTQPVDRLARDVAFYWESYPQAALSADEINRWQHHIPISAQANFGLSDGRLVPLAEVLPEAAQLETPQFTGTTLTEAERSCPASIRKPIRTTAPAAR